MVGPGLSDGSGGTWSGSSGGGDDDGGGGGDGDEGQTSSTRDRRPVGPGLDPGSPAGGDDSDDEGGGDDGSGGPAQPSGPGLDPGAPAAGGGTADNTGGERAGDVDTGQLVEGIRREQQIEETAQTAELEEALSAARKEFPNATGFAITGTDETGQYTIEPRGVDSRATVTFDRDETLASVRAAERDRRANLDAARRQAEAELEQSLERQLAFRMNAPAVFSGEMAPRSAGGGVDLERGEDFTTSWEGTNVSAELTPGFEEEFTRKQAAEQFSRELGVDIDPAKDIAVDEEGRATLSESGKRKVQEGQPEQFGDLDWSAGLSGEADEVERAIDTLADFGGQAMDFAGDVAAFGATGSPRGRINLALASQEAAIELGESGERAEVTPGTVLEGLGATSENLQDQSASARAYAGIGSGAAIPAVALQLPKTGIETAELAAYGTAETVEGRGGEFASDVGGAGVEAVEGAVDYARENPFRTGGMAVASLASSAAVMRGAASISPRAGLASRVAIQPGEEVLGYGGGALTRRVAGARAADRLFPNNEPVIFSEEFAIRQARRATRRARADVDRALALTRGEESLPPSPRQRATIEALRAEGPTGAFDPELGPVESGVVGARSEPLGSPTEGILDATIGRADVETGQQERSLRDRIPEVDVRPRMGAGLVPPEVEFRRREAERSSFEDVQDDALTQYQDFLTEQRFAEAEAQRDVLGGTEAVVEGERARAKAAQRTFEAETERSREAEIESVRTEFNVGQRPGVDEVSIPGFRTRQELGIEPGEAARELEGELAVEAEAEGQQRAEAKAEAEVKAEADSELEFRADSEGRTEVETFDDPGVTVTEPRERQRIARKRADPFDVSAAGWTTETFAAITFGTGTADVLESADLTAGEFGEVGLDLEGEEAEAFEEVRRSLSF